MGAPILILGGGISGLLLAWFLQQAGQDFVLLEQNSRVGGHIMSEENEFGIFDFGPNTIRDKTGDFLELFRQLGLEHEVLRASDALKTRYIVRNKKLQCIKPNPLQWIFNPLLSPKAKFRLLCEPFQAKSDQKDESIKAFCSRRFGKEVSEYLIDPVFSGIYAGDISTTSAQSLIPKLLEWEHHFESVSAGLLFDKRKAKSPQANSVFSLKKGMAQLTEKLKERLSAHIHFAEVSQIRFSPTHFEAITNQGSIPSTRLVSCLPAYALAQILPPSSHEVKRALANIKYAPVASTHIVLDSNQVPKRPDGFGFLVPRCEHIRLPGAIWKSAIFPQHSNRNYQIFNLLSGGSHDSAIARENITQLENELLDDFSKLMSITNHLDEKGIACLILDTCNRTELFAFCDPDVLKDALLCSTGVDSAMFDAYGYCYSGEKALWHLYRVACGLDSLVLGDIQIIQQVKKAYGAYKDSFSGRFHSLMQSVFKTHKRVRHETDFGRGMPSVAYAATATALAHFNTLSSIRILLVGTGKMGKITCKNLFSHGAKHINVVNRTVEKAHRFAREWDVNAYPMEALDELVTQADLIIAATGASEAILSHQHFTQVEHPVLILDLGIPRNVDPELAQKMAFKLSTWTRYIRPINRLLNNEKRLFRMWNGLSITK